MLWKEIVLVPAKTHRYRQNSDTKGFAFEKCRTGFTPLAAQNTAHLGRSGIDGRATPNKGYAKANTARRGMEKVFGWIRQSGWLQRFILAFCDKESEMSEPYVIAHILVQMGSLANAESDMS